MKNFLHSESGFWESDLARRVAWLSATLSSVGFIDALYLTFEHYSGGQVTCIVTTGCDKVLTGPYSEVFGIPIALIGVLYYIFVFSGAFLFLFGSSHKLFRLALMASAVSFLASLWFVSLQLFIVKAICFYCMISAFCSLMLFLLVILSFFHARKIKKEKLSKKVGSNSA